MKDLLLNLLHEQLERCTQRNLTLKERKNAYPFIAMVFSTDSNSLVTEVVFLLMKACDSPTHSLLTAAIRLIIFHMEAAIYEPPPAPPTPQQDDNDIPV